MTDGPELEHPETQWIESPAGWGDDDNDDPSQTVDSTAGAGLFEDPDPSTLFRFPLPNGTTLQLHGYKLDSTPTAHSTGVTLWQAAPLLGNYLLQLPEEKQKRIRNVLELGAGLGLPGLVAHHALGAERVVLTDGDTNVLEQLRRNVVANPEAAHGTVECRQLLWGRQEDSEVSSATQPQQSRRPSAHSFDTILGADVIYGKEALELLFETIAYFLEPSQGQCWISWVTRWNNISPGAVQEAAARHGLEWQATTMEGVYRARFPSNIDS